MSTPLQKQRQREDAEYGGASERQKKFLQQREAEMGPAAFQEALRRAAEAKNRLEQQQARQSKEIDKAAQKKGKRLPGPPPPDLDRRLANVARYVEPILASNSRMVETHRFVSLVDVMASNKLVPAELQAAADKFKELYLKVIGPSQGVGSYGEYQQASPASQRMLTTDSRLDARTQFMAAFRAVFGIETNEGRWVVDQQLMKLVLPAILSDEGKLSQADIGRERTRYTGRAQVGSAGGAIVLEALNRLCLHFQYKAE